MIFKNHRLRLHHQHEETFTLYFIQDKQLVLWGSSDLLCRKPHLIPTPALIFLAFDQCHLTLSELKAFCIQALYSEVQI